MESEKPFMPMHRVATRLGLPIAWLKDEAQAGRIPFLKAGRQTLMNIEAVERILLDRAQLALHREADHA